jgi:hypothetical protein
MEVRTCIVSRRVKNNFCIYKRFHWFFLDGEKWTLVMIWKRFFWGGSLVFLNLDRVESRGLALEGLDVYGNVGIIIQRLAKFKKFSVFISFITCSVFE